MSIKDNILHTTDVCLRRGVAVTDMLDATATDAAATMDVAAMVINSAATDAAATDAPTVALIDSAAINSTAVMDVVDDVVVGMLLPLSPKHIVRLEATTYPPTKTSSATQAIDTTATGWIPIPSTSMPFPKG